MIPSGAGGANTPGFKKTVVKIGVIVEGTTTESGPGMPVGNGTVSAIVTIAVETAITVKNRAMVQF